MTERPVVDEPSERPARSAEPPGEPSEPPADPPVDVYEPEDGLILGRPVEDRSFEVVEVATGASLGIAIGAVVGGPLGAGIGGVVGAAAGLIAGETIEHAVGRAAETTDATEPEPTPPRDA
jgi:hypothetical protein